MTMDLLFSLVGIMACTGLFLLCHWRASLPHDKPEPRYIPWRILSFACIVLGLLIVAHLLNLAGLETGPDKSPFGRI